ncbi:hypothetical protein Tco_1371917, partial [Tanacetum coccineum]
LKVIEGSIEKVRESEKKNFQRDNGDDASSTTSKRERSLVRRCFEKIDGATPADKMAACHNCDKVFSVNPNFGTKNLKRQCLNVSTLKKESTTETCPFGSRDV